MDEQTQWHAGAAPTTNQCPGHRFYGSDEVYYCGHNCTIMDIAPVNVVARAHEAANKLLGEMINSREQRTVSSTGGEKGVKLERFDLIPVRPLADLARRYGVGAEKYEERNWERGYEWSKSYAALQRHLNTFWSGEDEDPETPGSHLSAAAFHIFALMEFVEKHPEFDDRPKNA